MTSKVGGRVVVFGNFLGECGGIQQKVGNFTARFRIQPLPLATAHIDEAVEDVALR